MSPLTEPTRLVLAKDSFKALSATGGSSIYDIAVDGVRYRVHEFRTTGISTFTVSSLGTGLHPKIANTSANSIEYLIVAGGASGSHGTSGQTYGGGGGGGAVLAGTLNVTSQNYTVIVGAGGIGVGGNANNGNDGQDSTFASFTAGGGKKGLANGNGGNSGNNLFAGGLRFNAGIGDICGGGGGGSAGDASNANGGIGVQSSITGVLVGYGGGGGGSGETSGSVPLNGTAVDGGGQGAGINNVPGNGLANRGGGGGSTRAENLNSSGAGGSGIVIVRYAI